MSGPPPKDPSTRARRNDPKKGFRILAGREGGIPPWPLKPNVLMVAQLESARDRVADLQVQLEDAEGQKRGGIQKALNKLMLVVATFELQLEQSRDDEVALWNDLWSTPQAVVWEEAHSSREVAQYVRWKIQAEQGDLKAASEARQLSDRLGLNPLALTRLRLEIERAEETVDRGAQRRAKAAAAPKRKNPGDPRATLRAV